MLTFFSVPTVQRAIDQLAAAGPLTVVAGAGASMEIGLPSWEDLVLRLLDDVVAARGWADDGDRFRATAREGGLLAAAELVGSMLGGEMSTAIKHHLYGDADPAGLRPGPLARAIADLQADRGPRMRIATTNYDEVLELALRELPPGDRWWTAVRSSVGPGEQPEEAAVVTHLHGLLGRRDRGKVVLSEGDYQRMQLQRSWQETWMVEALSETTCLFVGASMTDANLIRYLYGAGTSRRHHVALFRRRPADTADELRFRDRAEEADRARWERLGITPLFADHFADVAQFVREVAYRRRLGIRYRPVPERIEDWFQREGDGGCLYCEDDQGYEEVQELLHDGLERLGHDVRRLLAASGVNLAGEKLALALLSLYPPATDGEPERVVVLASSDRIMTAVDSIAPIRLEDRSDWTGVKVICRGVPHDEAKDNYASRWRYVLGFPVYTDGVRTPLGAVTIASMSPASALAFKGLPAESRVALAEVVSERAQGLLTLAGDAF